MILCFVPDSNTIHHFNQNKYDSFLRSIPFHQLPCSHCAHRGCLHRHAYYTRRLYIAEIDSFVIIRVLRVRCTRCGTTHALLPHFVIPYQHIPLIDTASSYQNEKAVGDAIRKSGIPREELFITTKAYIQEMGYEKTKLAFEWSLKNLGLDYLDLYLIHMPFGDYYGAWRAMEELYEQGKIRAVGICNFLPDRLLDLCKNVRIRPMINQIEHHPHDQRDEEIALMKKLGVQPEAWAPFAEGLKGMFSEPLILELAQKYHKTPGQILLRWNIENGCAVIPKTVHESRMRENLDIWDFQLSKQDLERMKELDKGVPSMLDTRDINEIERVYAYLDDPVLTTLK